MSTEPSQSQEVRKPKVYVYRRKTLDDLLAALKLLVFDEQNRIYPLTPDEAATVRKQVEHFVMCHETAEPYEADDELRAVLEKQVDEQIARKGSQSSQN